MRALLVFAAPLTLASCGSPDPAPATTGAAVHGSLVAAWPASGAPREVRFSRDGRLLAASDASGLISVRDTATWREIARLQHAGGATSLAFSSDGGTLYSGGYDGAVRIWDVHSGNSTGTLHASPATIWTLDVSADGQRLAAAGEDSTIHLWTLATPDRPLTLQGHQRNIWEVRFSPDGKLLASGSFDKTVRLWNAATGAPVKTLTGHQQAVVGLAFSPDGRLLASSGDDSTIRLWQVPAGTPVKTIEAGNHTYKLAFAADGRWLVSGGRAYGGFGTFWHQLTGGGGGARPIRIWRTADWALVDALPADDDIAHLAIGPDGRWLVSSTEDGRFRLWRLRTVRR